jgi:dihydrofolate synthase/folylpolyglutamate synthase
LFTSPHLVSITERLQVNGRSITKEEFARQLTLVVDTIKNLELETHPTFFETVTATALNYFAEETVDIAILEVGLGGRLDSTNAVDPILSVLTTISYDHQQYLGNTLSQIGAEKAGILRAFRPAVSIPQIPEVQQTVRDHATKIGSQLREVDLSAFESTGSRDGCYRFRYRDQEYQLSACGEHQISNAAVAITAAEELRRLRILIREHGVISGIQNTRVPGVIEKVGENPAVFLDGGHNPEAAANLARFLKEHTHKPRKLVFGIMKDKMLDEVSALITKPFQEVYLTQISSIRAATIDEIQRACPGGIVEPDLDQAYRKALSGASTTVVAGSFHLVGEIIRLLDR